MPAYDVRALPADTRWRHDLPPSWCWVHLPIFYALWCSQRLVASLSFVLFNFPRRRCLWGCENNLETTLFFSLGPVLLVLIIIILISCCFVKNWHSATHSCNENALWSTCLLYMQIYYAPKRECLCRSHDCCGDTHVCSDGRSGGAIKLSIVLPVMSCSWHNHNYKSADIDICLCCPPSCWAGLHDIRLVIAHRLFYIILIWSWKLFCNFVTLTERELCFVSTAAFLHLSILFRD